MKTVFNWRVWLHGLIAAFIGGGANAIAAAAIAPDEFNLNTGLRKLGILFLVSGILNAAGYLKQSPVPKIEP